MLNRQSGGVSSPRESGELRLSPMAADLLQQVLEQAEQLQRSNRVEIGLRHLVTMLRTLRELRREIA